MPWFVHFEMEDVGMRIIELALIEHLLGRDTVRPSLYTSSVFEKENTLNKIRTWNFGLKRMAPVWGGMREAWTPPPSAQPLAGQSYARFPAMAPSWSLLLCALQRTYQGHSRSF